MRIIIYCTCGNSEPHFDHYECDHCHTPLHELEHPDVKRRWSYCPFCGYSLYKVAAVSDFKAECDGEK